MRIRWPSGLLLWCAVVVAAGCSDGDPARPADGADDPDAGEVEPDAGEPDAGGLDAGEPDAGEPDAGEPEGPVVFDEPAERPACESARRPIIAAHGFLASGDTWANHAMRLTANGYCFDDLIAFDWNTLDGDGSHEAALDAVIEAALEASGADKVDLIGHSAGGGLGVRYLSDPARAARVAHYAHVGSAPFEGPAGPPEAPIPTLNLWSEADLIIADRRDIEGATNVTLTQEDHYGVATSGASFEALFRFFNEGQAPDTTEIQPEDGPIFVAGRAVTLGENVALAGATGGIFVVGPDGRRVERAATLQADGQGRWGPFIAEPGLRYELEVRAADPDAAPIHYYREPFVRSNPLVYLRGLPAPGGLAGALLGLIPFDQPQAVVVVFLANRALRAGVDSLTVGGLELANEALASPEQTTIALFLYDDGDGQSTGAPVRLFDGFPFLAGADFFSEGDPSRAIPIALNGRDLSAPSWPANPDGTTIVVFE